MVCIVISATNEATVTIGPMKAPMIAIRNRTISTSPISAIEPGEKRKRLGEIGDRDIAGLDSARDQIERMKDRADPERERGQPVHRMRPDRAIRDKSCGRQPHNKSGRAEETE